jgi:2-aminoethylphosphonate-pyruvate transaminase
VILLNPGPVVLSERVRGALLRPDLCHREAEFSQLQEEIRARLLGVYALAPEAWSAVLLGGSGTAAVEAMLASLVPQGGRLLVLANGVYGERMAAIARAHGIECRALELVWGAPLELGAVREALRSAPGFGHVAVVHHETTTGRLNPLGPLAALCAEHGAQLLVDAVSSFGAERIAFGEGLAACAATANKCLHGAPGVSFVIARRDALRAAATPARGVYLDLQRWATEQERGGTPFTPPIPSCYALREALAELAQEGGWSARGRRYARLAEQVRTGLERLGIAPHLPPQDSSAVLRSYALPAGLGYDALHDELKKRGFVIYAGQAALRQRVFRISTMGAITDGDLERLLAALAQIVPRARQEERVS